MKNNLKLNEKLRLIFQAISFAFHNGYLKGWSEGKIYAGENKQYCLPGLNCYSCPGAIGACPIGSLQAVLDSGKRKYSLYVLGFIGAIGVIFGRVICGWACPFGFIQDLLYRIPLFKKIKNLKYHDKLKYLRFVILIVFVIILPMTITNKIGVGSPWFCEYICPSGTLLGGIPLLIKNPTMRGSIGLRFYWKLLILIAVIVLSIKAYRPFCKYICPLGALYGLGNKVSLYRLKVNDDKCIKCKACQNICGMDIKVWQDPNSMDCIRCGKCKSVCPTGAITSSLDDVINVTGFTSKHQKLVKEDNDLDTKKYSIFVIISSLLLIISGCVILYQLYENIYGYYLGRSYLDDRESFVIYFLICGNATLPAIFNIIFGIKLFINRNNKDKADELLENCLMAIKLTILVILAAVIYSIVFAQESAYYVIFYLKYAYIKENLGIILPICALIAYYVLKLGIKKAK